MISKHRRRLFVSASACVMSCALWPMVASAQDASTASDTAILLDEIVVTAQRRAQLLQDVPIAVTAFSDEQLERLQVESAADLQRVVPNFSYTATNFGGVNYTIRGIGASVLGDGADTGVALHYNGAFLQGGGNTSLFYDVEAVEVLRGPQGTLFGRNATGGAVNLRTKRPQPRLEARVEGRVGSFETRGVEAMINLPVSDQLATRFALVAEAYDGDVRNLTTGNLINGTDVFSGRASARWTPGGGTTIDLSVTYLQADGDGMQAEKRECRRDPIGNLGCLPSGREPGIPNYSATLAGLIATSVGLNAPGAEPFSGSLTPIDRRKVALDFDPRAFTEDWIAALEIEHAVGPLTFNSITSWASQDGYYVADTDFAVATGRFRPIFPGGVVPTSAPDPQNLGSLAGRVQGAFNRPWTQERASGKGSQWLQELRVSSDFEGDLQFLLGAFYIDFERSDDFYQISSSLDAGGLALGAAPPFFRLETPVADLQSYAVFGELYYKLSDTLRVTGGLRWTKDEKQQVNRNLLYNLPQPFSSNELTQKAVTGRAVLEWDPNLAVSPNLMTYASISRGYKGGGFNPQGNVAVPPTFEPEYVNAFEVGVKALRLGPASANLSAFYYDYDGFQVSKIVNRTSVNENIDAAIWGFEIESTARVNDNFAFDLSLGYLNTEIGTADSIDPRDPTAGQPGLVAVKDTASGANCVATTAQLVTLLRGVPFGNCAALGLPSGQSVSLKGNELANSPPWTVRIGAQYATKLVDDLRLSMRLDYAWRSDFWGRIYNRDPIDRLDSWGLLNGQAELTSTTSQWFVRLEGSNLLDEDAVTGMYVSDASSGLATNLFLTPRRRVSLLFGTRF